MAAASTVCYKLLEFSSSHDATFYKIYLQLVVIRPGVPSADTLAVSYRVGWFETKCQEGWGAGGSHREL